MTILPQIAEQIDAIRGDRRHGANWLAQQALRTLAAVAEQSPATTAPELLDELMEVAAALASARPAMTPIRYWVETYRAAVGADLTSCRAVGHARRRARTIAERLVRAGDQAQRRAARRAWTLIPDDSIVLTCSSSATVLATLRAAAEHGRRFRVVALESIGIDGTSHGQLMARHLAEAGIVTEVLPDAAAERAAQRATIALIGADTILADGSVVNGTPSLALARAARSVDLPLYVAAEFTKVQPALHPNEAHLEPGFDLIPLELVSAIVTDAGQFEGVRGEQRGSAHFLQRRHA